VRDHQANGRPIVVARFAGVTSNPGCQIAFVSGTEAQPTETILAALRGTPVLTVTDGAPDEAAGIVNFLIEDNHVRFAIDANAAKQNGLTISSKLLNLAVPRQGAGLTR
jgi:hypothetical protein